MRFEVITNLWIIISILKIKKTRVMLLGCKTLKGTLKITAFTSKTLNRGNSNKRSIGVTSLEEVEKNSKKPYFEKINSTMDQSTNENAMVSNEQQRSKQHEQLSKLMEPFFKEFKSLKETINSNCRQMDQNYEKLESTLTNQQEGITKELHWIETAITNQKAEIVNEINDKVEVNAKNITRILEENKALKKE